MTSLEKANWKSRLPIPAVRRGLRVDSGLSLADISHDVGVSRMTIHRWESGIVSPRTIGTLVKYVTLLEELRNR